MTKDCNLDPEATGQSDQDPEPSNTPRAHEGDGSGSRHPRRAAGYGGVTGQSASRRRAVLLVE